MSRSMVSRSRPPSTPTPCCGRRYPGKRAAVLRLLCEDWRLTLRGRPPASGALEPTHSTSSRLRVVPSESADIRTSVVLMDELDQLLTAKQDVVYNFFNWPTMRDSQLFVVAVANRMDLPQHLAAKIKSRLGESDRSQLCTQSTVNADDLARPANTAIPAIRPSILD